MPERMARLASRRRSPTYTVHVPQATSSGIHVSRRTAAAHAIASVHTTATVGASRLTRCHSARKRGSVMGRLATVMTSICSAICELTRGRATSLIVRERNVMAGCRRLKNCGGFRPVGHQEARAWFTRDRSFAFTWSELTKTGVFRQVSASSCFSSE